MAIKKYYCRFNCLLTVIVTVKIVLNHTYKGYLIA